MFRFGSRQPYTAQYPSVVCTRYAVVRKGTLHVPCSPVRQDGAQTTRAISPFCRCMTEHQKHSPRRRPAVPCYLVPYCALATRPNDFAPDHRPPNGHHPEGDPFFPVYSCLVLCLLLSTTHRQPGLVQQAPFSPFFFPSTAATTTGKDPPEKQVTETDWV